MGKANDRQADFWESTFLEAYDIKSAFLNRYEDSPRSYPRHDVIGKGGVKTVYKSFDWKTDRDIALAVPNENQQKDLSLEFIHEAIILGRLEHPNIIPVYDTGLDEKNTPYFTMKYVEGQTLEDYCHQLNSSGSFENNRPILLDIFKKVCLATSYAHSKDIIHLDIKPSNVIIGKYGEVFLCDWGLSDEINKLETSVHASNLSGTPGYISPERLKKVAPTKTMDVYSLGCLLYFLYSDNSPISHSDLTQFIHDLKDHNFQPLKSTANNTIPNSLVQIFEKCCQENPSSRYQSVYEIIDDIDLYTNGFATKAESASALRQLELLYKRHIILFNVIVIFLIILTGTTIIYILDLKEKTRIAIEEKQKSDALAKTLSLKKEENQKFIDQLLETADKNFRKERLSSTQYILEDILTTPLKQDEVQFRLAQISIGQFKWRKAQKCLDLLNQPHEESLKLQVIIDHYATLENTIEHHYQLALDTHKAGFLSLYQNLSADLINRKYNKNEKSKHTLHFFKIDNQIDNTDRIQYHIKKNELIIKHTELSEFRMISSLKVDRLKILNSHIHDSIPNQIEPIYLDLKDSLLDDELKVSLSRIKHLTMPKNKLEIDFHSFSNLEKLTLPKGVYEKNKWKGLKARIDFY